MGNSCPSKPSGFPVQSDHSCCWRFGMCSISYLRRMQIALKHRLLSLSGPYVHGQVHRYSRKFTFSRRSSKCLLRSSSSFASWSATFDRCLLSGSLQFRVQIKKRVLQMSCNADLSLVDFRWKERLQAITCNKIVYHRTALAWLQKFRSSQVTSFSLTLILT